MRNVLTNWRIFKEQCLKEDLEKQDIFPGSKELDRLAKGMVLAEEEEDFLLDYPGKLRQFAGNEEEEEITEANPSHCPEDHPRAGQFGCSGEKGAVYSISKKGAKSAGIDPKYAYRGVYTGNKDSSGTNKTKSSFGAASGKKACGRKDIQKGAISPKYSCSNYSNEYGVKEAIKLVDGYLIHTLHEALTKEQALEHCRREGLQSFKQWLQAFNSAVKASKGELGKKS